jgi:hypothetical protein
MKVRDVLDRVHPADEHLLEIEDEEAFFDALDTDIGDFLAGEDVHLRDEPESTADPVSPVRRCADCPEPAMARKGSRGPEPKRCEFHTRERKRHQDNGGSKARGAYAACCAEWQADGNPGHTGLCPQHEDHRDENREWQARSVTEREINWLLQQLGHAETGEIPKGWHLWEPAPKGWKSARGPWEGRTRPDVHHGDPFGDTAAKQWIEGNQEQFAGSKPKSNRVKVGR